MTSSFDRCLDFVNHSIQPNTRSVWNGETREYEIRLLRPIPSENEQLTFLYNPHSNVDLFIEYGFVLENNLYNQLDIRPELKTILTNEQFRLIESHGYWNTLELYPGDGDISWTILKVLQLIVDPDRWNPFDDPPFALIRRQYQQLIDRLRSNIDKDFEQWETKDFLEEKRILLSDFLLIVENKHIE